MLVLIVNKMILSSSVTSAGIILPDFFSFLVPIQSYSYGGCSFSTLILKNGPVKKKTLMIKRITQCTPVIKILSSINNKCERS